MNINFGLFPPLAPPPASKDQRKPALVARARADLAAWMAAA
jgi:methylenetetrahydrofolate--tRNA-(uracil-5-)-methyltransferase